MIVPQQLFSPPPPNSTHALFRCCFPFSCTRKGTLHKPHWHFITAADGKTCLSAPRLCGLVPKRGRRKGTTTGHSSVKDKRGFVV
jgi:hypothetical protein